MSATSRPSASASSAHPASRGRRRFSPRRQRHRDRLHGVALLQREPPSPADLDRALDQLAAEWNIEL